MEQNTSTTTNIPVITKVAEDVTRRVVNQMLQEKQYEVSDIQSHVHNGTDSSQITFPSIANAMNYRAIATVTLSSAQIKALNTTPVTIVPSMGVRTVVIVEGIDAYLGYNGTAYTGTNALEFRYTDASGAKVTADISTTLLNSTAIAYSHVAGVTTELVPVANKPIVVRIPIANPAAGTSPITFQVTYRTVSFN